MNKRIKTYSQFINEDNIPGGLAKGMSVKDLANRHGVSSADIQYALDNGIQVELEHTTSKDIAREIAMDHLYEDPKYYEKLATIEENINEMIKHRGNKWLVFTKDGKKLLGTHNSKKDAESQLAAIEISKHKG